MESFHYNAVLNPNTLYLEKSSYIVMHSKEANSKFLHYLIAKLYIYCKKTTTNFFASRDLH